MRLASLDAQQLAAWLCGTLPYDGEPIELHVLARHWELRCGALKPFVIEWDEQCER
jgi:hypothetical protein